MAISRKSSHASASRCFTFLAPSLSPSFSLKVLLMASMAWWVLMRIGPLPAFMSRHHEVVADGRAEVVDILAVLRLGFRQVFRIDAIVLAEAVGCLGLEEQEPCADRAVTVLEAGGHEAVLHHGQLCAGLQAESVTGAGVPYRVPCAALAFLGRPGTEHVHGAAGCQHHGLCLEDVDLVLTDAETGRCCNAVRLLGIIVELHDEYALVVVRSSRRWLRGWSPGPSSRLPPR